MTLVEFLLARVEGDETLAAARLRQIEPRGTKREVWAYRQILAECEAKRQIVKLAQQDIDDAGAGHDDPIRHAFNCGAGHHAHNVLRLLAQAYADHPDYREEWRP